VAFFSKDDARHAWAVEQFSRLTPPVHLCEPVLIEACFMLQRAGVDAGRLLDKVRDGAFAISFRVEREIESLGRLIHRYRNLPMSLADACLVRMSELHRRSVVVTLDSHFRIYRRNGRQTIPLLIPF
jgi:predicted nucleic acid-binding protein